jgi:SHS2 domain-containing protein
MGCRWVEHTGEVELEIEAPTEEAVLREALQALAELLGDGPREDRTSCEIAVVGEERAPLLAERLDELVYRAETQNLVLEEVERLELAEHSLYAVVRCRQGSSRHLVKDVAYHRLAFEPGAGGFRARVVVDV